MFVSPLIYILNAAESGIHMIAFLTQNNNNNNNNKAKERFNYGSLTSFQLRRGNCEPYSHEVVLSLS